MLLPLLLVLPLLGVALLWWSSLAVDRLLTTKVRADLAIAHGYFRQVQGDVGAGVSAIADSHAMHRALAGPEPVPAALLRQLRDREGLDFLNLREPDGRIRLTDEGADSTAETAADASARRLATVSGLVVLGQGELELLSPALRERVAVPLVPTRNAAPTERQVEDRAMVLLSTRAVHDDDGRLTGHLQGGVLLNRNLGFIDHINEIVYPEGALPFGSRGTATLFLDDVRISTNVRLFQDEPGATPGSASRAIGTRVSQTVRDAVLGRGATWLDRAFVVSDWYVSGYMPLRDAGGRPVGMLYVGFLERPFTLLKYGVLATIGAIFFAVMIVAAVLSLRSARQIFRPLERMESTMQRVEAGDLAARVGPVGPDHAADEIGRLAGHLDRLLGVIDEKTGALRRWNADLDAKVAERSQQLEEAQAHLMRNEKLATVGQLTASVAHEINNPIAVLQGNLDLMRELLGADGRRPVQVELRLMDEQLERMRLIVTQLLQFARPGEYAGYVDAVDAGAVLDDCLVLVGHLLARTRIRVVREISTARTVLINRQELQQVLVNLMVNAIDAMPDGGELRLTVEEWDAPGVAIRVCDSGPGVDPALLGALFRPFSTRKKDGTGLGLWISRSLVERYGGDIVAANRDDGVRGACFLVLLRSDAIAAASASSAA